MFRQFIVTFAAILTMLAAVQSLAAEDEVVVIADLNLAETRREIKLIEQELYQLFNSLVDDENMAIECYDITPTGSHRTQQVCEPTFLRVARAENANDAQFGVNTLLPPNSLIQLYKKELDDLQKKMEEVAAESNQFAQLVSILNQLRAHERNLTGN